jgi:RAD3-like DEAD/DEAH box helicase
LPLYIIHKRHCILGLYNQLLLRKPFALQRLSTVVWRTWTNAKRQVDEEWYYWQTALKLMQANGRSVRSKDDWAKTYILDSAFSYFVKKNINIFPYWFRQAIKR